jgi:hypothetical protein
MNNDKETIERYEKIKVIIRLIKELPAEDKWLIARILNIRPKIHLIDRIKVCIDRWIEYYLGRFDE